MDASFVRRGNLRLRVAATRLPGRCCGARGRAQHWLRTVNPHLILMRTVHLAGIAFIASGDRPLRTEMMRMIFNMPCCPAFCTLSLLYSAASGRVSRRTRIPLTTGAASDRNVDASCFTRSGQAH